MLFDFETGRIRTEEELRQKQDNASIFGKVMQLIGGTSVNRANAIIIHVHGGGFVAMSSGSH